MLKEKLLADKSERDFGLAVAVGEQGQEMRSKGRNGTKKRARVTTWRRIRRFLDSSPTLRVSAFFW